MGTPFGNECRTGEYPGAAIAASPETAWVFECDAAPTGSPAWDGDLIVVLDVDGGVHGLDAATGERRWSHRNEWGPTAASGSPVITPTGVLHIHEEEIIELDRRTGAVVRVWEYGAEHITGLGDVLLVDGSSAVDIGTRAVRWKVRGASMLAPPAVHDGIVVAADGFEGHHVHGGVHAFRAGTGEPLWSIGDRQNAECRAPARGDGGTGDWEIPGQTHPVIADGRVWFTRQRCHNDGEPPHPQPWDGVEFVACDLATGAEELVWSPSPERHHFGPLKAPAHANGLLLCVVTTAAFDADGSHLEAGPDEVLLTALDGRTAEPSWSVPLPDVPVGSPVVAGGSAVHVATGDGTVVAVDLETGRTRWTYACGEPVGGLTDEDDHIYEEEPAPLVPGDGSLLVQTSGSVRLLR